MPSVGESVTQATVGQWQKKSGDFVRQNDVLVVLETDKASMDLVAEHSGRLHILKQEGEDVKVGDPVGEIDTSAAPAKDSPVSEAHPSQVQSHPQEARHSRESGDPGSLSSQSPSLGQSPSSPGVSSPSLQNPSSSGASSFPQSPPVPQSMSFPQGPSFPRKRESTSHNPQGGPSSPGVRKLALRHGLDVSQITGTGPEGRIQKQDVLKAAQAPSSPQIPPPFPVGKPFLQNAPSLDPRLRGGDSASRGGDLQGARPSQGGSSFPGSSSFPRKRESTSHNQQGVSSLATQGADQASSAGFWTGGQSRERMSTLRKRIAQRLVSSQHSTATLTTFNEVDMSEVMSLRSRYKESFQKTHQIKLGFMGFFIRAVVKSLEVYPRVNAFIEGGEVVYNHACHIGVAVSTDKGLVVPVIKNAHALSLADLEKQVAFYAEKARDSKLMPDDLSGGTFTLSNGGVFGSLMSTPILNPPQSGILGMHKIQPRPVAVAGEVQIKPMMYVALSYDHRMVDGRESVGFLQKIKEFVENPIRLLMDV